MADKHPAETPSNRDETRAKSLADVAGFDEWAAEVVETLDARREAGAAAPQNSRDPARVKRPAKRPRPSQA